MEQLPDSPWPHIWCAKKLDLVAEPDSSFHFDGSLCGGPVSEIHKVNEGQLRPIVVDMGYFTYPESIQILLATITLIFFREPPFPHFESKSFGWVAPNTQRYFRDGHRTLAYQSISSAWTWRLVWECEWTVQWQSWHFYWKNQERKLGSSVSRSSLSLHRKTAWEWSQHIGKESWQRFLINSFTFPDPGLPFLQCCMALTLGLKIIWVRFLSVGIENPYQCDDTYANNCVDCYIPELCCVKTPELPILSLFSLPWPLLCQLQSLQPIFFTFQVCSSQPLGFRPFCSLLALTSFTPDLWTHMPRSRLPLPSPLPHEGCCVWRQAIIQCPHGAITLSWSPASIEHTELPNYWLNVILVRILIQLQ